MSGSDMGQCTLVGDAGAVLALAYGLARSPRAMLAIDSATIATSTTSADADARQLAVTVTFDLAWALDRLSADPPNATRPATDAIETLTGRTLADVECDLTWHTLARCRGDRERAAMILGIPAHRIADTLRGAPPTGFAPAAWPALR